MYVDGRNFPCKMAFYSKISAHCRRFQKLKLQKFWPGYFFQLYRVKKIILATPADKYAYYNLDQRYTYRVLQTIQIKLMLLSVWAEPVILGSTKTALKFKQADTHTVQCMWQDISLKSEEKFMI